MLVQTKNYSSRRRSVPVRMLMRRSLRKRLLPVEREAQLAATRCGRKPSMSALQAATERVLAPTLPCGSGATDRARAERDATLAAEARVQMENAALQAAEERARADAALEQQAVDRARAEHDATLAAQARAQAENAALQTATERARAEAMLLQQAENALVQSRRATRIRRARSGGTRRAARCKCARGSGTVGAACCERARLVPERALERQSTARFEADRAAEPLRKDTRPGGRAGARRCQARVARDLQARSQRSVVRLRKLKRELSPKSDSTPSSSLAPP